MNLGAIFLLLAVVIIIVLILSGPFLIRRTEPGYKTDPIQLQVSYSTLLAEKERLLNTLQELDMDYESGKIPEEAYPIQRKLLLRETAVVLSKLDGAAALTGMEDAGIQADQNEDEYDDLEEMIAKRKQSRDQNLTV